MATLADLAAPLHALAARTPDSPARQVEITQRGAMLLKQGGRAMPFTATSVAGDRVTMALELDEPFRR